jgi:hypothetical protein
LCGRNKESDVMRTTLWLGAALVLVSACQRAPAANAAANGATANVAAATNAVAAVEPRDGVELRIGGFGLAAGQRGLHPSSTWTFGMPRAEIVAAVAAIRGPATAEDSNAECGAGAMDFTHFGPLTLNFQQGRWVGWDLSAAGAPPIRTEFGIGIGTPRAELAESEQDELRVEESTLGTEFSLGDLNGLLSGSRSNATVTHLWAGTDCAFR